MPNDRVEASPVSEPTLTGLQPVAWPSRSSHESIYCYRSSAVGTPSPENRHRNGCWIRPVIQTFGASNRAVTRLVASNGRTLDKSDLHSFGRCTEHARATPCSHPEVSISTFPMVSSQR